MNSCFLLKTGQGSPASEMMNKMLFSHIVLQNSVSLIFDITLFGFFKYLNMLPICSFSCRSQHKTISPSCTISDAVPVCLSVGLGSPFQLYLLPYLHLCLALYLYLLSLKASSLVFVCNGSRRKGLGSGSEALSHSTSHQNDLWPLVPLITRLLMVVSLGENQFGAKDDGRWSLQPITDGFRAAVKTNQAFTEMRITIILPISGLHVLKPRRHFTSSLVYCEEKWATWLKWGQRII